MARNAAHCLSVIGALFVMAILYLMESSSSQNLQTAIGEAERKLAKLDDALAREQLRWEMMKTPEKIERALLDHGLSMRAPHPSQNIRIRSDGTISPQDVAKLGASENSRVVTKAKRRKR